MPRLNDEWMALYSGVNINSHIFVIACSLLVDPTKSSSPLAPPPRPLGVAEIVIFCLVILLWVTSILYFIQKWGRIRKLQPMEPKYVHNPESLMIQGM